MKKLIALFPIITVLVAGCSLSSDPIKPLAIKTVTVDVSTTSLTTTTNNEIVATTTINEFNPVSICNLTENPSNFVDKQVKIKATLVIAGDFADPEYYLEDLRCQILTSSWAPQSVSTCPPSAKVCNRPKIMSDYLHKSLIINGILKEMPKSEYINKQWVVTGTYYIFVTNKSGVLIVQ